MQLSKETAIPKKIIREKIEELTKNLLKSVNFKKLINFDFNDCINKTTIKCNNVKNSNTSLYTNEENKILCCKIDNIGADADTEYNCPICHSTKNENFILPCRHLICKECLFNYFRSIGIGKKNYKCPLCKKIFYIKYITDL